VRLAPPFRATSVARDSIGAYRYTVGMDVRGAPMGRAALSFRFEQYEGFTVEEFFRSDPNAGTADPECLAEETSISCRGRVGATIVTARIDTSAPTSASARRAAIALARSGMTLVRRTPA
jgi:hypothetical protein